jgi:ornithine carbamoyltransferase
MDGAGGQDVWQRFTERARRTVFHAQEEAARLGENYVSTEHLLLGLLRENDSVAARVLNRMEISLDKIRADVERQVTRGDGRLGQDMQLTPRAKRVIDLAYDEARILTNDYIGTEHLLLALIREREGLAARVLAKLGAELERTRNEIIGLHDNKSSETAHKSQNPDNYVRKAPFKVEPSEILRLFKEYFGWRKRSLLTLTDVSAAQFKTVLEAAIVLKAIHADRSDAVRWNYPRTLGMIFEKPSLRTRASFEAGMVQLGGHAIYLAPADIGLGTREPVADVASALSRWVDVISARVFKHETVEALAANANVPVINALSDREHPIQAFADLLTLEEQKGELGNNLKIAYIGDGNNVLHALLLACAKMGVNLSAACPDGYLPDRHYVELAQQAANESGAKIAVVSDPAEAVEGADALYTDVWTSMGQEEESRARAIVFAPYQINEALVAKAKPDAIVLHCLPAHCGEEISADVFDKYRTVIMDQAENRMHTQKALIALMIGI